MLWGDQGGNDSFYRLHTSRSIQLKQTHGLNLIDFKMKAIHLWLEAIRGNDIRLSVRSGARN